jgi:hypothetical protein
MRAYLALLPIALHIVLNCQEISFVKAFFMSENQPDNVPDSAPQTLEHIRLKMESLAEDYDAGKLNQDQFDALFHYYSERLELIERMVERNPESDAWRKTITPGVTSFLRSTLEAQAQMCIVLKIGADQPLFASGKLSTIGAREVFALVKALRKRTVPPGMARRKLSDGWLAVAVGQRSITLLVYRGEPTTSQLDRIRETHALFERANAVALEQNTPTQYVFPQRALAPA